MGRKKKPKESDLNEGDMDSTNIKVGKWWFQDGFGVKLGCIKNYRAEKGIDGIWTVFFDTGLGMSDSQSFMFATDKGVHEFLCAIHNAEDHVSASIMACMHEMQNLVYAVESK